MSMGVKTWFGTKNNVINNLLVDVLAQKHKYYFQSQHKCTEKTKISL
jgi:hypothetical protein